MLLSLSLTLMPAIWFPGDDDDDDEMLESLEQGIKSAHV